MPEIKDTDWAYAAGFVDGEGCIAVTRNFVATRGRFYYGVAIVVVNRDRRVLDWMHELWDGCVVAMPTPQGKARDSWAWRRSGISSEGFLHGILPWLRLKRAQCENALSMVDVQKRSRYTLGRKFLPPEWLALQEEHYWRQREMNHRGNTDFVAAPMHSPRKINRARSAANRAI